MEKGFKNLNLKYGKICGFWFGPQRAVLVTDFEILQEILNKSEASNRHQQAAAGKTKEKEQMVMIFGYKTTIK